MGFVFNPVAAPQAKCKCCDGVALLYDVADFNKNCEVPRNPDVLPVAGVPVYYYRCKNCAFIFTPFFDAFTPEDFSNYIYNDQYILVDPDYKELRPQGNAGFIADLFGDFKNISVLDYGGGNGTLEKLLKQKGFSDVTTYDPFSADYTTKPQKQFDLIVSFEVFEHTTKPKNTLKEVVGLLKPNGILMFSTLMQPANINTIKTNWWYIGPRNGHVSIYSEQSLQHLAEQVGYQFGHFNEGLHLLCREIPVFAQHFLDPDAA
jgi:2-polyprenyl-6-hydroxyphenyl methylase/3-demethylubiquinone-9 3-methyltransferase